MRLTKADARTDWQAVRRLLQESFDYMEARLGHPARAAQATPDDLAAEAETGTVLLAFQDAAIIACLFCRPSRDHAEALYIGKLAVAASHRGQGLARRLVEQAANEALGLGFAALTLDTGKEFPELHKAFGKLGFGPPATRAGEPDVVTMTRWLSP